FTLTVSGKLPFAQDLLISKMVKAESIRRSLDVDEDGDSPDIDADFVLLRRELRNTVITSDLLKTLRAVATNQAKKALMDLHVVTAAAYRKSDRMEDCESWCRHIMALPAGFDTCKTVGGVRVMDKRSRAWYGVPLAGFVSKLKADRERLKRQAADKSLDEA